MKKIYFIIFLIIVLFPVLAQAEEINAGFVSGVWYSREPFFAGDKARIYSAIQNQSGFDIVGKMEFYDNQDLIGTSDFSVISGRLIEQWADWQVTKGEHSIYTRIVNAKKSTAGQQDEPVELKFAGGNLDEVFADTDTDGDRIGDRDDDDDDNDGASDQEEIAAGANPLDSRSIPAGAEIKDFFQGSETNVYSQDSLLAGDETSQELSKLATQDEATQKIKSDFSNYVVEPTKAALEAISVQSQKITRQLTEKAEEKKSETASRLEESRELSGDPESAGQKKLSKDEIYLYFLFGLIYILNTWWLLLIAVFILLKIIWRIVRRLMWF